MAADAAHKLHTAPRSVGLRGADCDECRQAQNDAAKARFRRMAQARVRWLVLFDWSGHVTDRFRELAVAEMAGRYPLVCVAFPLVNYLPVTPRAQALVPTRRSCCARTAR
jgi:hypothetical protein